MEPKNTEAQTDSQSQSRQSESKREPRSESRTAQNQREGERTKEHGVNWGQAEEGNQSQAEIQNQVITKHTVFLGVRLRTGQEQKSGSIIQIRQFINKKAGELQPVKICRQSGKR